MKQKRSQFLSKLYEMSGGDKYKWSFISKVGEELNFDHELSENIAQYLEGEGLIKFQTLGGGIGITQKGIRVAEKILSKLDI